MSTTCPNGHVSSTADYCDQCGAPIAAAPTAPPASSSAASGSASAAGSAPVSGAGSAPSSEAASAPVSPSSAAPPTATLDTASPGGEVETSAAARRQPCPQCGAPRTGDDRYCEGCGYDFLAAPPAAVASPDGPAIAAWEAVTSADRAQFDRLAPAGLTFPSVYAERRFPLTGTEVVIGRSHPPDQPPDINLAAAPEDPAVSHRHAALERQDDGSYKLRDLGSTNGTTLNDDPTPVSADVAAPVADGDRIHVGAWTTITLRRTS